MGLGASALLAGCGYETNTLAASSPPGPPKRGGRLRVALSSGGPTDTLDPARVVSQIDYARAQNLFDTLAVFTPRGGYQLSLAQSFEPNKDGTAWTVRLQPGVKWHDGSDLTASDVMYSLRRIQAHELTGANTTALLDLSGMRALDTRTIRIPLKTPIGDLPGFFAPPAMSIVKEGSRSFAHPIGTGPFVFESWEPGESSTFTRNPDYWRAGKPYLDSILMESISDDSARVYALLGSSVDCCTDLGFPIAKAQLQGGQIIVLESPPGPMIPITMAVDAAPFNDARVRQAMRLIADRRQLLDVAQLGFGAIGNDLFGKGLTDYDSSLPQRRQDLEQARSLLRQAGHQDLRVTIDASSIVPGMIESATVFAQQAKGAGVNVVINNIPVASFYGTEYLKYPFAQSEWTGGPIDQWMQSAVAAGAPYNETHWKDPAFDRLFAQARATLDKRKRRELMFAAQKILYDRGGYLIWGFYPYLDGLAQNVHGAVPSLIQNLGNFTFLDFWKS